MNPKHHQQTFSPGLTCCVICSSELSFSDFIAQQNAEHLTCLSVMCKQILLDIKKMPREQADFFLEQQGILMQAQRQEELDRKAQKIELQKMVAEENQAILEHIRKTAVDYDVADLHIVSIPNGQNEIVSPGKQRIEAYAAHVKHQIAEGFAIDLSESAVENPESVDIIRAVESAEKEITANPDHEAIDNQLCGICKGGCCAHGGNHGYLNITAVLRVRKEMPELGPEEMLELYLSHVSSGSVEGGCIHQTANGCSLPRNLRSTVCNQFFCSGLTELHARMDKTGKQPPILAIQRRNTVFQPYDPKVGNDVINVSIIDERGVRNIAPFRPE